MLAKENMLAPWEVVKEDLFYGEGVGYWARQHGPQWKEIHQRLSRSSTGLISWLE